MTILEIWNEQCRRDGPKLWRNYSKARRAALMRMLKGGKFPKGMGDEIRRP